MMKSFFKKLAFVMALAMVVSMAAPAGSALAAGLSVAYQNGGAVSELNVKAGAEQDLKFLGAPKNWKDLGFAWTSSNEAVATVDQAGLVTAVADGTATITITVGDLSGSVVVNVGEAKAYDVTLGTADNKAMTAAELKEGASLDLNFYGVKDWNKNNYTVAWSVSGDAANVDKNGVVTAVKAGKAVVTASIVNNLTGVAHKVAPVEVTVAGSVNPDSFTVAQKDTDKFVLTFAEAKTADAVKDGLTLTVRINDKDYPISFENVAVDGNKVTVTTYSRFENDEVYTFAYGSEKVVCTIVLGEVASVGITYYTGKNKENHAAYVMEEEENDYVTIVPTLYDEFGNDVTEKYNMSNFDFSYEVSENVNPIRLYNDVFAFNASGIATVTTTATWVTDDGELKEVSNESSFVVQKRGKINLSLEKASIAALGWQADDNQYAYDLSKVEDFRTNPNSIEWTRSWIVNNTVPMVDTADWTLNDWRGPLYYTAVFKDNRGNLITSNSPYLHGTFSYESTNVEVLDIATDGLVTRNKAGKANILVYFEPADGSENKKLVASTLVTITPEVYPVSFKMLNTAATTASDVIDEDLNDVKFYVQFYDQFNAVYSGKRDGQLATFFKVEARDDANKIEPTSIAWDDGKSAYAITFDGTAFKGQMGTNNNYKIFSYKFSLEDADLTNTIKTPYTVFSLTVKDTYTEKANLVAFINSTKDEAGNVGVLAGDVPTNYKFNISLGGNLSKDVAVRNVVNHGGENLYNMVKTSQSDNKKNNHNNLGFEAKYLSTGNLAIARVPAELLVDNTDTKLTTGFAGYVYYKVTAPSKTTELGSTVDNDAWTYLDEDGKVRFTFNNATTNIEFVHDNDSTKKLVARAKTAADTGSEKGLGDVHLNQLFSFYNGWNRNLVLSADGSDATYNNVAVGTKVRYYTDAEGNYEELTCTKIVDSFKYAGAGNYTVSFATTSKNDGKLYNIKTSTIAVTNTQSQIKYVGLNPNLNGVTELALTDYQAVIQEQLRFSFEELFLGEYYDDFDGWRYGNGSFVIDYDDPSTKITTDGKSLSINSLVFKLVLDELHIVPGQENADDPAMYNTGKYTIKVKVPVGARIKAK